MKKLFSLTVILLVVILQAFPQNSTVYALKYASTSTPFPVGQWAKGGPMNDSVGIDFVIWLIKGNNGKNILVDAGFLSDIPNAKDFGLANYTRPDSMLLKLGVKATDISDIIFTHPHWDHLDGIDLFPNAHIWIQKEDYNYFVGDAWRSDSTHGGFHKRDVIKIVELNLAGKVTLVDGDDKEILPGIKVFTGSRHTYNSQYVLVNTGKNKIVLASDNIWIYYNLEHMAPAPPYGTFDAAGYVKSMQRMKTQVTDQKFIVPGHDSRMFTVFPSVMKGIAEIK